MYTYHTSYCRPLDLYIETEGRRLTFSGLPGGRAFDHFMARLVGTGRHEAASATLSRNGDRCLRTGSLPDGMYTLEVLCNSGSQSDYRSFIQDRDAVVKIADGAASFCDPACLRDNISIIGRISQSPGTVRSLLRDEPSYPCGNSEIRRIASVITAGLDEEYGKLLAIHDWVAENVFYDHDSLRREGGTMTAARRSTMDVLKTRRAVCQGYSDLAVSFMRACGIPSVSLGCFALGQGTEGGWENPENRVNRPNHAFTAALMGNRYVLMDITWDSDNAYSEGRYRHCTGLGKSRKYFDMSPALFSASHRMIYEPGR